MKVQSDLVVLGTNLAPEAHELAHDAERSAGRSSLQNVKAIDVRVASEDRVDPIFDRPRDRRVGPRKPQSTDSGEYAECVPDGPQTHDEDPGGVLYTCGFHGGRKSQTTWLGQATRALG